MNELFWFIIGCIFGGTFVCLLLAERWARARAYERRAKALLENIKRREIAGRN
jgi:hypothetical protein